MTAKKKTVKKVVVTASAKPKKAATAASILGQTTLKGRIEIMPVAKVSAAWAKYQQNLLDLRDRLLHQMSGLAKESAQELPSYSLHMADSGTDNFDRDFALRLLSSDQDALY